MAELAPLEREADSWTLPNGLRVSERRIPIGTVGANFEARPNVALDVAGQLLKSLNTAVLRTGGAALRTVTVLVDEVLRPALEAAGLPPARSGSSARRSATAHASLVSLPQRIPLVILRGSGETTAALARLAAENGVRTLAHAEGGGVLYVHGAAVAGEGARARRREPRPARRLQPAQPPPRRPRRRALSCPRCSRRSPSAGSRCAATSTAALAARPDGSATSGRTTRSASRR